MSDDTRTDENRATDALEQGQADRLKVAAAGADRRRQRSPADGDARPGHRHLPVQQHRGSAIHLELKSPTTACRLPAPLSALPRQCHNTIPSPATCGK
jgi:hypothetical protein